MVRSEVVASRNTRLSVSGIIMLLLLASAAPAAAQDANSAPGTETVLESLLDRAGRTPPGTYVIAGSQLDPAPAAIPVILQGDVVKGPEKSIRATVALGAEVPHAATVRLRLVSIGTAARVVAAGAGHGPAGALRLVHGFNVAPGEYELHAAVGHSNGSAVVAALAKSRFVVPDVWNAPLAVTPVVLGDDVQKADGGSLQPFVFGPSAVRPAASGRFAQTGALDVAFRVYNWAAQPDANPDEARPDLTVEYVFYQMTEKRPVFFNKVKPQRLSAETLGTSFDPSSRAVAAGMRVPLLAFPFGDFEMRVRVTDNRSKQSTEQRVEFRVGP